MNNNGCTGQLIGPFQANEELYNKIQEQSIDKILYIKHIGIQIDDYQNEQVLDKHPIVYLNGEVFEISKTGIYEVGNVKITSIYFPYNMNANTIIDYAIETANE